ncbi:uncharacterized protein LOC115889069 [Sitophilus oryzae]|uniref:Uncharacterized protein LOC115889069 n=1 Tax=Sitophilus oryzae TaxID=7048 RepID=A0A6J2YNL6_SITOR|nr:uncharacterized protein LOC115889069 [Sitophilus oryzae]
MAEKRYNAKYKSVKRSMEEIIASSSHKKKQTIQEAKNILIENIEFEENCNVECERVMEVSSPVSHLIESDESVEDESISSVNILQDGIICSNEAKMSASDNFRQFLCSWAKNYSVNHSQLNNLLKGLNEHLHLELPSDARTILSTARQTHIKQMTTNSGKTGSFCYIGIAVNLKKILSSKIILSKIKSVELKLIFNIDGVPLSKSSNRQFWPILGKVWVPNFNIYPFPVAIFCGDGKPNLTNFFSEFITEINNLLHSGIELGGIRYSIKILCFTCDAPARAFAKCIKGHNGKYGCERCNQQGLYHQGRMLFKETKAALRTNEDFKNQIQQEHHHGVTPLLQITDFNCISLFVLDSMHLCFLGVMKKLLKYWHSDTATRLHLRDRTKISEYLEYTAQFIPEEFSRKSRGLYELDHWKATELRLFALYTGVIVLKNILPSNLYYHFVLYHSALRILFSNDISDHNLNCSRNLLLSFVGDFEKNYGNTSVIYNVHSLIHITDDVQNLKVNLNDLSCFSFESYLGKLVKLLRTPNRPLAQVVKRLSETQIFFYIPNTNNTELQFKNCLLTSNNFKDSFIIMKNNKIAKIKLIRNNELTVNKCLGQKDYFSYPFPSRTIGIHQFHEISNIEIKCKISDIKNKLLVIKELNKSAYVAFELLHTS